MRIQGHAIEARLYAENPANGFLPSTGRLDHLVIPEPPGIDVRIDSGVEKGDPVTPYYDPMIAKVIVHSIDRDLAREGLAGIIEGIEVWPVRTNAGFLGRLLRASGFVDGAVTTGFIEEQAGLLTDPRAIVARLEEDASVAIVSAELGRHKTLYGTIEENLRYPERPWRDLIGFRLNAAEDLSVTFAVQEGFERRRLPRDWRHRFVSSEPADGGLVVFFEGEALHVRTRVEPSGGSTAGDGAILAPMPGRIVSVDIAEGDTVKAGQKLVVIEAMKMEQGLVAPFDGVVAELKAAAGAQVSEGALLARVEKQDA